MKRFLLLSVTVLAWGVLAPVPSLADPAQPADAYHGIVAHYLDIQKALVKDTLQDVPSAAAAIAASAEDLLADFSASRAGVPASAAEQMISILPDLATTARAMSRAEGLDAARSTFGDLSGILIDYRALAGSGSVRVAHCPMAKESWLQDGAKIANPYYGASMLRCGSFVQD